MITVELYWPPGEDLGGTRLVKQIPKMETRVFVSVVAAAAVVVVDAVVGSVLF